MVDVLVVEDDADLREAICDTLDLNQISFHEAENGRAAERFLASHSASLVLSDVQMSPGNGYELLSTIRKQQLDVPVILMTAYGSIPQAVDAIQAGAVDYLVKPFEVSSLVTTVRKQINHNAPVDEDLVAEDQASQETVKLARRVAQTDASVLLNGESGVGKEVYSRFIHQNSSRAEQPFVAINCAAIPENMLEAVLFGYEKGAFTGAHKARQGRFELAEGGVIFLDEIGDMPLPMQVKLLRVLQERCYEKVGSNKSIKTDVRVIAATHRRLEELIAEGKFREDLFYRLNVFPIEVPPLRERASDIPLLIHEMIARIERENRGSVRLSKKAIAMLQQYNWPGNVRELANLIERLAILFPHGVVDSKDLPGKYQTENLVEAEEDSGHEDSIIALSRPDISQLPSDGIDMKKYLTDIEIALIEQALSKTNNVVARAATMLNMRRTTLVEKMRKYEIERAE